MYNFLKGISEAGVKVTFLSLNTKKHFADKTIINSAFPFLKQIEAYPIDTDVNAWDAFTNLFGTGSYNISRFFDVGFAALIQRYLNQHRFDVIQFEGLFVSEYVKHVKVDRQATAVILRQHNVESNIWSNLVAESRHVLKRWYLRLLAKRLFKFEAEILGAFDRVVAIAETDEQMMREMSYRGEISTIPAGMDVTSSNTNVNHRHIYHIGSMEWQPNCEAMQWFHDEIWPILKEHCPEAEFYMAGKQMPQSFKSWDRDGFHVEGEVANQAEFISGKSILAVPLRSGSGIRVKTIEAMMAGKAVVTTSKGLAGIPAIPSEHCLVEDSTEGFATALALLVRNTAMRDRIAENGRKFAIANYSNEAVSRQWIEFYEKIKNKS